MAGTRLDGRVERGNRTRQLVLRRTVDIASVEGLEALSVGRRHRAPPRRERSVRALRLQAGTAAGHRAGSGASTSSRRCDAAGVRDPRRCRPGLAAV